MRGALYKKIGGDDKWDREYNLVFGGNHDQVIELNEESLIELKEMVLQALPLTQEDIVKHDRSEALKLLEREA